MDKIDFLSVFESHMKQLEGEYNEARKRVRDIKWRHARKCRAVFKECLSELYSNGNIIGMGTKWKDVYPLIKSDVRFLDMLGLNGSTPLELFWDLIMVEGERFEADRKIVMSIVKVYIMGLRDILPVRMANGIKYNPHVRKRMSIFSQMTPLNCLLLCLKMRLLLDLLITHSNYVSKR